MDLYALILHTNYLDHSSSQNISAVVEQLDKLSHDLIEISRKMPESWYALGLCYDLKEEHEKSLECLDKATAIDPSFSRGYQSKGKICAMTAAVEFEHSEEGGTIASDLYEESIRCFRKAIALNPDDVDATEGLIFSYLNANPKSPKYKEAIFAAQEIYTRMTSNHRVEVMLGNVLSISRTTKTRDKARTLFKNALKRCRQQGSNPLKALLGLVKLYSTDKDYQNAIEIIRYHIEKGMKELSSFGQSDALVALSPHDLSTMWVKLGEVYAQSGNSEEAMESYHMAISLAPEGDCPLAIAGLEELHESHASSSSMDLSSDSSFLQISSSVTDRSTAASNSLSYAF
jgi:tetratricopeptide (TPR) repeat protein